MAVKPSDFKSDVYTNSTTLAQDYSCLPLVCTLSAQSTPEQRQNWSLEPGGYAIYWEDLDDGLEVAHLLGLQPLV